MNFRYGLTGSERACATVCEWDDNERRGFAMCPTFKNRILVRESEVMFPAGLYFIPTDDIGKGIKEGSVIDCMVIETVDGLLAIGGRKSDMSCSGFGTYAVDDSWERVGFPRLMGVVSHYNYEKSFGFIRSDTLRKEAFFQKSNILVPYDVTLTPYEAMLYKATEGDMVTFDLVEGYKGPRALSVKKWKGEKNGW